MNRNKIFSWLMALVMMIGMALPAQAAEIIKTDVVIHKNVVKSDYKLQDHDGKELATPPGAPLEGVIFKYWTIDSTATDDDISALKDLKTIEEIEAYASSNPTILSKGTLTDATDANGKTTVAEMPEGRYIFGEVNGDELNVTDYIGVPFLLELPAMAPNGAAYYGVGEKTNGEKLHIYPKNATNAPGLTIIKTNEDGKVQLGGAEFEIQKYDEVSKTYKIDTTLGTNGIITIAEAGNLYQNLPAGKYQLVESKAPAGYVINNTPIKFEVAAGKVTSPDDNSPLANFEAATDTNPNATLKIANKAKPEVEKTEGNGGTEQIGKDVIWNLSAVVPSGIKDYKKVVFTDTISSKLDFLGTDKVTVQIDGTDVPESLYTLDFTDPIFSVTLKDFTNWAAYEGKTLVITYKTAINDTAIMGQDIPNNVELNFDNGFGSVTVPGDPENPPVTPEVVPKVWTGGAQFKKVDGKDDTVVLPGAEFKISTDAAGTNFLVWTTDLIDANVDGSFVTPVVGNPIIMKSGADGIFEIKGLKGVVLDKDGNPIDDKTGVYYLVETKAPTLNDKTYNLLRDPQKFTITKTSYDDVNTMKVVNNSGLQIPQTGGIGTAIFTIAGLAIMIAGFKLFKREKQK